MSDIIERLRADYCNCIPAYKDRGLMDPQCESCQTMPERTEAANEIERLRAENDTLRGAMAANDERLRVAGERVGIIAGCDTAELMADEIECLLAEVAGLREDAERYRWLRDMARTVDWTQYIKDTAYVCHCRIGPQGMDAAIDAARKGEA